MSAGPRGLEGRGRGAGRLLKNGWLSEAILSLAGVEDAAPPWAGKPVAAGVLEAPLVGQPRSRSPGLLQM